MLGASSSTNSTKRAFVEELAARCGFRGVAPRRLLRFSYCSLFSEEHAALELWAVERRLLLDWPIFRSPPVLSQTLVTLWLSTSSTSDLRARVMSCSRAQSRLLVGDLWREADDRLVFGIKLVSEPP